MSVRNRRLILTADRLQGLSDSITALSESVSQVAAVVADR